MAGPSKIPGSSTISSVPAAAAKKAALPITCIPGRGVSGLAEYVGKSVESFCPFGYGTVKDKPNHCAHFVCHALNIQVGVLCSGLLPWKKPSGDSEYRRSLSENLKDGMYTLDGKEKKQFRGASTRVNEVYNSIDVKSKGDWDKRPDPGADCLIYATISGNISADRATMGGQENKHIGVYSGDKVYNYSNSKDVVVSDTVAVFQAKFIGNYGKTTIFLWSVIPDVGDACVHYG